MSDVAQACADLAAWYPAIQALTTQPDTTTVTGRKQPGSQPPWNAAAANAWTDIHAGTRELENNLRYATSGRTRPRGGSDGNTLASIDAIARLADTDDRQVAALIDKWIRAAEELPAVDLSEPARRLPGVQCGVCGSAMVMARPRSLRLGCATCRATGIMMPGTVSDGYVAWDDGTVT